MGTMSLMDVGSFTVEDLYAYREQRDDMTVQLIEGEFGVSPSPGIAHQGAQSELFGILRECAPAHLRVLVAPLDLRAGERSVLQPDLMVVSRDLRSGSEVTVPPTLAVEILSPSSQRTDLVRKPEVLATFGCPHYWVIDPLAPAIRAFDLVDGLYSLTADVTGDETFTTDAPFAVSFRPTDLVT